jgi:hypothetical protein
MEAKAAAARWSAATDSRGFTQRSTTLRRRHFVPFHPLFLIDHTLSILSQSPIVTASFVVWSEQQFYNPLDNWCTNTPCPVVRYLHARAVDGSISRS